MADDQDYEASRLLKKILSPAEAQSLVGPPPAEPAPRTDAPSTLPRAGLAGYFAGAKAAPYVKILSHGQIGYLPKANLPLAMQIDSNLRVLTED